MIAPRSGPDQKLNRERWRLVRQLAAILDRPMTVLGFVWLVLLIVDFVQGLSDWLLVLHWVIWGLFGLHFGIEFLIAPDKFRYLRKNWLTAIALVLPAFRVVRVFSVLRFLRVARAARAVGFLRLLTTVNRGIKATRRSMRSHGAGYVAVLTLIVVFAGAAAMYVFERPAGLRESGLPEQAIRQTPFTSYAESLWWTSMTITTMAPSHWPQTTEGRVLMWCLAVYGFGVFGYITAAIASMFLGQKDERKASVPEDQPGGGLEELRSELRALRAELRQFRERNAV